MKLDLYSANKLIKKLAGKDKNLSPVKLDDYKLFKQFLDKEPHTYGNSWTYITQGVYGIGDQNLGYKYYDGKNVAIIAPYPKIEQQEVLAFYWVRPMGDEIVQVIDNYSKMLLLEHGVPTYVKKIFKRQRDEFLKRGFEEAKNYPWHTLSHSEDDTFPEQIYETVTTLKLARDFGRKKQLRKSYLNAQKLEKERKVEFSDHGFQEVAWNIANCFFQRTIKKDDESNLSTEFDYYNMIFNNHIRDSLVRKVVYVDGEPLGFYVYEIVGDYTNIYALIVLRDRLQDLVDSTFINIFKTAKTKYINVGGSEEKGMYKFKKKYHPIREQQMYWVTRYKN